MPTKCKVILKNGVVQNLHKFENPEYYENVIMKNEYWQKEYDTNKYIQYVYFHKSNEGKSIDFY